MKTKNFKEYLEKRLDKKEIAEIEKQANLEIKILIYMKRFISDIIAEYMSDNKIGFNEFVKRLDSSPAHVAKIQRGEANLTLSSLAHLFASMDKKPSDIFKGRK